MDGNVENNTSLYDLKGKIIAIPAVDNTLLKTGYAADAKVTGEELAARVKTADVVDNLTTEDAKKPLSANQGAVIKKQLDAINLSQAGTVGYNNSTSGLAATNMQSAIDEVAGKVGSVEDSVTDLANELDSVEENYLNKKGGGMVEGSVKVRIADNGFGTLNKNNSATEDNGTQMIDTSKTGKTAHIDVCAADGTFNYTDPDGNERIVHHEGTKPFSNYTGNGNAASRTIATKGIGRLLLVYCSTHCSLVTPKGAWVTDLNTGEIDWFDAGKVYYVVGNLITGTSNAAFNASGETYYYQGI